MQITIVVDSLLHDRAGTERQLRLLAAALSCNHRVEIIVLRRSDWLLANAAQLGVSAVHIPFQSVRQISSYLGIWRLWKHLRATSPDIVHTFMPVSNILGVIAARLARVPVVISSRRDYGEWMTTRYLHVTRLANRFADHVVTNSIRVKLLTTSCEGVPADKISVIPNGMELSRFLSIRRDRTAANRLSIPADATIVGLVANFRPMKRHDTAIEAARILLSAKEKFVFLLIGTNVGNGDLLGHYRAVVQKQGLGSHVLFLEEIEDVVPWLAAMDIGLNASEGEGLSNAVMEYMAAGLPCVIADSGGNPDLVEHGKHGLLFPVGNATALADTLLHLRRDPVLASRLAFAARQRAQDEFSVDRMTSAMETHYRSLLKRKQSSVAAIPYG